MTLGMTWVHKIKKVGKPKDIILCQIIAFTMGEEESNSIFSTADSSVVMSPVCLVVFQPPDSHSDSTDFGALLGGSPNVPCRF